MHLKQQQQQRRNQICSGNTQIIVSPLKIQVSPIKWFTLNLNHYRNTHYQILNKAKINYKLLMREQIDSLPEYSKIEIKYILYPANKRLTDIGNVLSIHQKFFEDALVELGKIKGDTYIEIPKVIFKFGHIDKLNPRVEIEICKLL